jgi:hypothetical protein
MCSSTGTSNSTYILSHYITLESHLDFIISTLYSEEANTSFSSLSQNDAPISWDFTRSPVLSHIHVQLSRSSFSLNYIGESSRVSSQLSTQRSSTQCSSYVSDRNHTPNSWDLSQVCVIEDVSHSCNHQHSLSAREELSIMLILSRKYSNFFLVVVINTPSQLERYSSPSHFGEYVFNLLMCRKVLHGYFFPLHHVSEK